jgi:ATP-dependent DNA helicase RecQ
LYVAPERFASGEFTRLLAECPVSRFVIDEAHCVSAWGHDFRPDYRRLKAAAVRCRSSEGRARPPIAAFTATATPEVRADVIAMLGLESPEVMVAGFDRPNIFLRVERVSGDAEKHEWLPELTRGRRALVYAATRKTTEAAARQLNDGGIEASAYHAGLKDNERTRVQDAFAEGRLRVVCATNAFGMGIDRPDVDAVVHLAIPGSVEAYYQEIGRAGRDGRDATATLLWDYADVSLRQFLIDSPRPGRPGRREIDADREEIDARRAMEHSRLQRMIGYADTVGCLRGTVLNYFGDPAAHQHCGACGNCRPNAIDAYERERLRTILNGVVQSGQCYGRRRIIAMLAGDTSDLPALLRKLPSTGALRGESIQTTDAWLDAAFTAGLVAVSNDQYRTLRVTESGREVMRGGVLPANLIRPARMPCLSAWPQTRELHTLGRRRRSWRREGW